MRKTTGNLDPELVLAVARLMVEVQSLRFSPDAGLCIVL